MSNFKSPSTGELCSPAQLIAEIMVRREAAKQKKNLPDKFWNYEPWKKKYKAQIIAANGLLRLYEPLAILNALKRKECSWQYSLRVSGMNDIFKEEQAKLDDRKHRIENMPEKEYNKATETEIKKFGKESKFNKLRD